MDDQETPEPSMKTPLLAVLFLSMSAMVNAMGEANLVPNPDFSDAKDPLASWRTYFPWESQWYANNGKYVFPAKEDGKTCALLAFPASIAANQAGKIESAFIKIEPGARYRAQMDVKMAVLAGGMKIHAEAWTIDPDAGIQSDKWRVPAAPDHPALVTCWRAQFPDPKGSPSSWVTASREFTVPKVTIVKGKEQAPVYLTLKAVVFSTKDTKVYITNVRLTRLP
jgi:hypothetical protein